MAMRGRLSWPFGWMAAAVFAATMPLPVAAAASTDPQRIVSVDHCADQYVLALADRGQIVGVSPRATLDYSFYAERAESLPVVRPTAEAILMARPDLVVRLWGGASGTQDLLARYDVPVAQVRYGADIATTRDNLRRVGEALGKADEAARLIADMDRRLEAARARRLPPSERPRAAYVTPSGTTAGAGTFVDAMMTAAGLTNIAAEAGREGWHPVDLEKLALDPPDIVVGGFFDQGTQRPDYWSIARHSFLRDLFDKVPFVSIPGRFMTCQAWYFVGAVERIQRRLAEIPSMLKPPQVSGQPLDSKGSR